ncbi:MAG: DUF72 domain-containing protein [Thermoanaerobaculia bacterium]
METAFTRFGTATWNYPGWRGVVYPSDSPEKMSSADRLALYAQTGRYETVEADFTFYRPQNAREWTRYAAALPPKFPVVSKVWEEITCERFPQIERQGDRGGKVNPNYLNVGAFKTFVLKPAEEAFSDHLGPFVFEFRRDRRPTEEGRRKFRDGLERFLNALPRGPRYAVEMRTREYFDREHVALLNAHGAGHVLNWWTAMPPLSEQFAVNGITDSAFLISRILVAPGRDYADAVRMFTPYDRIRDAHPEMRADVAKVARFAEERKKDFFLIVNNRAEGSAPYTINAIRKMLGQAPPPLPEPAAEDADLPL